MTKVSALPRFITIAAPRLAGALDRHAQNAAAPADRMSDDRRPSRYAMSALTALVATLQLGPVAAGQVQVTINGSPAAVCCGTLLHPNFLTNTYSAHYESPPASLQFAHEGATVTVDLATGTLKGKSFANRTANYWLMGMSDGVRIERATAGPGASYLVTMGVEVSAVSQLDIFGDVFSSIQSNSRLEFGRLTPFGSLSEIDFAEWRYSYTFDAVFAGGSESFSTLPIGDVAIDSADKTGFKITLTTTRSVFIGDGSTTSSAFGFNFFMDASLSGTQASNGTGSGGGFFDASHTAQFFVTLPPGLSLQSDSGLFLTAVPEPVPVPAAAWLLGGALPLLLRRRRARRAR